MEDDDEFGDLYTDVLFPPPSSAPASSAPPPLLFPSSSSPAPAKSSPTDDGLRPPLQTLGPPPTAAPKVGEFNWEEDDVAVDLHDSEGGGRALRVSGVADAAEGGDGVFGDADGKMNIDLGIAGVDSEEPVIPGLSVSSFAPPVQPLGRAGGVRASEREEDGNEVGADDDNWGSDSEDDLQIVLNDNTNPIAMDGREVPGMDDDDDDEDGEDLIIVANEGVHLNQPIEEQEGVDEVATAAGDGERKDGSDAGKVNGGVAGAVGARIGYNNHVYHPHHSQFKYVRPGASVASGVPAATGTAVSQVRPSSTVGSIAGRGRGEWRPMGMKGMPLQKNFYPGYGPPVWGSSARSFGSGSEFTLPSHKTVFDVDIDSFEEKPWKTLGVDISDYFNFGLDEDNWKNYCKQLEQFRLEATMQSKIRVYESGRSEQEYDPDLPPELAAAAGLQDGSTENANVVSVDGGQGDTRNQGNTATRVRSQLPTGRPIQVETGYGERLPSIDTRPPRTRDSDAIIEIVLHDDSKDDSITSNGSLEQPANESQVEDFKGDDGDGDDDHFTSSCDSKKETVVKRASSLVAPRHNSNKDAEIVSEAAEELHPDSDVQDTSGDQTLSYRERRSHGTEQDALPIEIEAMRELSVEQNDGGFDDRLALGDSVEADGEEMTSGVGFSGNDEDSGLVHSLKRKKLSSQVEPAVHELENGHELRPSPSDNSKPGSGSSRHYQKSREGGDEELVLDGQSRRIRVAKRTLDDDKHSDIRRDDYYRDSRKDAERSRIVARGREDLYPLSHRDFDVSSGHYARAKVESFERQKERDTSVRSWQRRDEDIQGRRAKNEDIRSRDQIEEVGSRHRIKIHENERNEKDEHLYVRKRVVDGEWRSRHEKDVGLRLRERDDILMARHEVLDDSRLRRRKDEELLKREHEKEEGLHGYRGREDRRKRERGDVVDLRRRDDQTRLRDKPDESHNSMKKRDENWRQRGKEDKQRVKKSYEEDKLVESARSREEPKGLGSDKECIHRDKRRQTEPHKRRDGGEEETSLQYRGHEDASTREGQVSNNSKFPRNDRSNRQREDQVYKERRKQNGRKEKEAEGSGQNTGRPDIRKQDDHGDHDGHEKVSSKITTELDAGAVDCNNDGHPRSTNSGPSKKHHHHNKEESHQPSSRQGEDATSDEEVQLNSGRGRSKLERWSSHKEKDGNHISQGSRPHKETKNGSNAGGNEQHEELHKVSEDNNGKNVSGLEYQDADNGSASDNRSVDPDKTGNDRHSDTVAKLKKRSERFKLPMPGEKDTSTNRKVESESVAAQNETANNAEIKQERPARKRRWVAGCV